MAGQQPEGTRGGAPEVGRRGPGVYPTRRRAELLERLRVRGYASVHELASELQVSDDTIRRDLQVLATQGAVERSHGGASLAPEERFHSTIPFPQRAEVHAAEKERIARTAASFVDDFHSVIVNGGTTIMPLARYIAAKRGVTVVTNNTLLPNELYSRGVRDIYVLGGQFRMRSQVTIGPVVLSDSDGIPHPFRADWAIIAVAAVSDDGMTSTTSLPEATMMRSMMESSKNTLILADSSKLGRVEFAQVAQVANGARLITDREVPVDVRTRIRAAGGDVIVAP